MNTKTPVRETKQNVDVRQNSGGSIRYAVPKSFKPMSLLDYVKTFPASSPIPHYIMTAGDLAELIDLVDELKQSCKDLQEGMRLMLTIRDEHDIPADLKLLDSWQDEGCGNDDDLYQFATGR